MRESAVNDTIATLYFSAAKWSRRVSASLAVCPVNIALGDLSEAIAEYEAETGKKIDKDDIDSPEAQLALMMCAHGKHKNLSCFAFTATPKDVTPDIFGTRQRNGSFRPFHTYSMRQAIEEGFIHDMLANYTTYKTCYEIVLATEGNPEVSVSEAAKTIKKFYTSIRLIPPLPLLRLESEPANE